MDALATSIQARRASLDALRPMADAALARLRLYYDVELTYTSNALEGNTLTHRETAEVVEHGITVGGKRLRDHLEALDHHEAIHWVRRLAAQSGPIGEDEVRELHRRIVARSQPEIAGLYSAHRRRVAGSAAVFPNPLRVPELMAAFGRDLQAGAPTPRAAFDAHWRLTAIHPFADGNGRAARLLMNLLLIRGGYPPIAVRPDDRRTYLDALEHGSTSGDIEPFQTFLHQRLDATLADYLDAAREGR